MNRGAWYIAAGKITENSGTEYYVLASCCTVLFNGFCRLCLILREALLYVGFHCLTLYITAYMAIFKCVGYFYFI
jgi:hypothetical protein